MTISKIILSAAVAFAATAARACDLCAIYNVSDLDGAAPGWRVGVAEQFTHFGTLQLNGREVANGGDQRLDSSITQALLGYGFGGKFSVQLSVPFIYRSFRRPEETRIDNDATAGIGDVALTGSYVVARHEIEKFSFTWNVTGGVKLPTGSTRRLKEETSETHQHGAVDEQPSHAEEHHHERAHAGEHHEEPEPADEDAHEELPESGIHGHDLTLGSGSWDGIVGTSFNLRYDRVFLGGTFQYSLRTKGDYDYRFANDLVWAGGPGAYLALGEKYTVALRANFSGEHKGKDKFRGARAEDTDLSAAYLGPELSATYKDRVSVEFGADFPLSIDNTALQIVPDYRLRAAISVRF